MQPLDKAFMGSLKTFFCQEIERWLHSHPGLVITVYQMGELFGNAYKWAATGERATNGFQATGLFPCDKIVFIPYDFPMSSEDTHAALVNHPASLNTSYQPSSSSANFSPFTSAVPVRTSDTSSVPSLNLKPNPCGGTANKITSSSYKNWLRQLRNRRSNRPLNPKSGSLRRMLLLVLQQDGREGFAGIQLRMTLHQIRTLT
jgi:hypothetical protein